jgi:PAS domain S-box-containing protein
MFQTAKDNSGAVEQESSEEDFFSLTSDLRCILDLDLRLMRINPAFEAVIGSRETELIGIPFFEFIQTDNAQNDGIVLKKALHQNSCLTFENRIMDAGGDFHWIEWIIVPLRKSGRIHLSGRVVTRSKKQEELLRMSYAAMESAASGIVLMDNSGRIFWVNAVFSRLSGYLREELLGESMKVLSSDFHDTEFHRSMKETISSGLVWYGEVVNRRPDGTLYTVEETIAPIRGVHGEITHYVSVLHDITERKKAERIAKEHAELLENEITLAGEVQASLLPSSLPVMEGFDTAARVIPARWVSGDLYDCFLGEPGHCTIAMADISGKGVPSAMLASSAKTLIRSFSKTCGDPACLLGKMNEMMYRELENAGMFITLFVAKLDISFGTLTYASAGHTEGIIVRGHDVSVELLSATGMPLGCSEEAEYETRIYSLGPGDTLIIYSDGVTEARNREWELFGMQRFVETVKESVGVSAESLVNEIVSRVDVFRQGEILSDDISLLVLRSLDRSIPYSYDAKMEYLEEMTGIVRSATASYGAEFSYQMELAASEIFTNEIKHAYQEKGGLIRFQVTLTADRVELDIYDDAPTFDYSGSSEIQEGPPKEEGYGLHLIHQLCDEVNYSPMQPKGNHWHAVKRREMK